MGSNNHTYPFRLYAPLVGQVKGHVGSAVRAVIMNDMIHRASLVACYPLQLPLCLQMPGLTLFTLLLVSSAGSRFLPGPFFFYISPG